MSTTVAGFHATRQRFKSGNQPPIIPPHLGAGDKKPNAERGVSPRTVKKYVYGIKRLKAWARRKRKSLSDLTKIHCCRWLIGLAKEAYSTSTINGMHCATSLFFDFLISEGDLIINPLSAQCVVVNAGQFGIIKQSVSKTDRNNARALAQFLSKGLLPSSRVKDELHAQVNGLATTRDKLVKLRTVLLNKVHAHLRAHGRESRKEAYNHPTNLRKVLREEWPASVRLELEVIAAQIISLSEGLFKLERENCELGERLAGHDSLTSIKGIGEYAAAVLLSIIGEVGDFADEDKLASYLGIVPRVSDSNATQHHCRITKRGSKLGRLVLVQCTLTAKRFSPYLRQYYERIKGRRGSRKALIATARKFLGIVYRTLKHGRVFSNFPNFVLAEP